MVFFIAAQNLYFVLRWQENKQHLKTWVFVHAAIVLCFLPRLIIMLNFAAEGGQVRRHFWLKLPQAIYSLLAGDALVPLDELAVNDVKGTLVRYWYYPLMTAVGYGLLLVAALKNQKAHVRSFVLLATMLCAPIAMSFLVSFKVMLFDER